VIKFIGVIDYSIPRKIGDQINRDKREIFYPSFIRSIPTKHLTNELYWYKFGRGQGEGKRLSADISARFYSSKIGKSLYYIAVLNRGDGMKKFVWKKK
jgi:hypothetical protein